MHNLIRTDIFEIQHEYLQLLQKSVHSLNNANANCIIDNVLVFWHSYRRTISLFLISLEQSDQAYLFTGASYLRVNENNHYPFTSLGRIRVIDDPLCKLAKAFPAVAMNQAQNFYFQHIIDTINDEIEILQKYNNYILILPVTFGFFDENIKIHKASINNFLYLFQEKFTSIEDYASKITTIEEIYHALKDEWKHNLPISDTSPLECGLINSFNEFKTTLPFQNIKNSSDSYLFFMHIHGMLMQSLDILLCCIKFNFVPYIRSRTCFYYTSTAASNFFEIPILKDINFCMTSAYILYDSFPEALTHIDFERYHEAINDLNVFEARLNPLLSKYLETSQLSFSEIQTELQASFEQIAEYFKVSLSSE